MTNIRHMGTYWIFLAQLAVAVVGSRTAQSAPVTTGLSLWLNANVGITTDSNGHVISWRDQSGQGHDASQSIVNDRPLFSSTVFNGQYFLSFNGSSDFLNISGQVITSQQFTIIAIGNDARASSDGSFRDIFSNWEPAPSNSVTSVFLGTTNHNPTRARFTDQMGGGTDPSHHQLGVGTISSPATPFMLSGVSGVSDATIYQNSVAIADEGGPLSARGLTTPYVVGKQGSANAEYWNGAIAELLVYNIALTPEQLQQDWTYLGAKYLPLAGDANSDGIVNAQDIGLLSSNWLATGTTVTGDVNGDGIVNAQDLAYVASNWLNAATWHASSGSEAAVVPEPSATALAMLGSIAVILYLRQSALRQLVNVPT